MLQELEEHIEGEKRNKRHKNLIEMRRGMLHSQLINEQMKGAQELREDTAQKMKTIELTEEEREQRKELRYEIWEAKVEKKKKITETEKMITEIGSSVYSPYIGIITLFWTPILLLGNELGNGEAKK